MTLDPEPQKPARLLHPVPRRLAWLHFWNDFTLDFISPLLPGQVGVALLGVMEGAADALGQALKLVTGRASDHSGRRVPWVRAGYAVNAVARPLSAVGMLFGWPLWIVGCRVGDRIGKGLRGSASDALVADWTPAAGRARAYAAMRTMDHLGATVGALAAAFAAWRWPDQLGWIVAALVLPMLVMLWLCRGLHDVDRAPVASGGPSAGWWPRERRLRLPLWLIALASLGAKISPLLVLARVAGWPGGEGAWPLWQACLAWAALGLAQSAAAAAAGVVTDRLGPRTFLVVGWLAGAALYAGLVLTSGWALAVTGLGYAVLAGFTEGAEKTYVAALAPVGERATTFGALGLLVALATLAGSGLCGWGMRPEVLGASVFWFPAAALAAAALALAAAGPPATTR